MRSSDPADIKRLSRSISNLSREKWEKAAIPHMIEGVTAKFQQNPMLREFLLNTEGTQLAEASPYDGFGGIGLPLSSPLIKDKSKWNGRNEFGNILYQIRQSLR